ncbi:MAG: tetratricopeptide repeat protein, partial [Nocardioides sp.]|nr:tetratricopeptide repeat protein [Nocardioides sp.]
ADTHFTLGLVHQRNRQTAAARTAYERALALDPDHAMARNNLTVLAGRWQLGAKIRGYAAGLRSAPDSKVLQENLDGLIRTFPIRLYVGALAALVVGMIAALATHPAGPATITIAAVFVAGTVGYTALTLRRLPGNVRGYFIRRLFRSPAALWSWLIFAVAAVLALATCLVPGGSGVSLGMFQPVFIALVVVRIVRAVSGRRRS